MHQSAYLGLSLFVLSIMTFGTAQAGKLIFSTEDPEERGTGAFVLDVGNDFDQYSIQFGDDITAALSFDQITDKFSLNRDLDFQGNQIQDFRIELQSAAPTCDGTRSGRLYFDTDDNQVYTCDGSDWVAFKTSIYQGYSVQDWDQTDGSASYIGRTRDLDSKWLITLSVPGGFTYAQEENNGGTTDFATAWTNRLTLNYATTFIR